MSTSFQATPGLDPALLNTALLDPTLLDPTRVSFRTARRADAHEIAKLFQIATDHVSDYIWSQLADEYPGQPLIEIGARRYARDGVDYSWENAVIAEHDSPHGKEVIGMMLSYAVPLAPHDSAANDNAANDNVKEASDDTPADPVLQPFAELECPGSLYISAIAVKPAWRNKGLGRRFLSAARRRAFRMGLDKLSLIAFEQNEAARRLYAREGFVVTDARELVLHPMIKVDGGKAFLMVRGAA